MTALQAGAVLACVRIISNAVSTTPLHVFERQVHSGRTARRIAHEHPMFDLLKWAPNEEMSSNTFRRVAQVHVLLWGNAYIEIQRDRKNRIIALWPRNPARTRPVRLTAEARIEGTLYPAGTLVFHTSETMGDEISAVDDSGNRMAPERIILAEDMIHLPGLSLDGRLGQSTVYLARQVVGEILATEKYGAKFFGNGAIPAGILTVPDAQDAVLRETLRRSWAEAHGGENAQRVAVLDETMKYQQIGIEPEKSQFLSTREYLRTEVAAIYGVPPRMIGVKVPGKSSAEQDAIEFLNYSVGPWIDTWEQELKRKLFWNTNFFARMDTHRLLYGDAAARKAYYAAGKQWGFLSTNDIHELEEMNPVEDGSGDVYWMPVNMQDAANPMTAPHIGDNNPFKDKKPKKPELPMGGAPQNPDKHPLVSNASPRAMLDRYERIYYPMFFDAFGRVLSRGKIDTQTNIRCFTPVLYSLAETLAQDMVAGEKPLSGSDFDLQIRAYVEEISGRLDGLTPELRATHATRETRRAVESFVETVANRYNPKHHLQPRKPDGTWHTGKKPFYLMRHASSDDDLSGVWSGWSDIRINDAGEKEIDAAVGKLKDAGIKRVVSSDLERARQTAGRIADALGVPMTTDWRLRPMNMGALAGLNEQQNAHRLQIYMDHPEMPIPGGDSLDGYRDRVVPAIDDYRDNQNETSGPILCVTHGGSIAMYLGDRDIESANCVLSNAGILKVDGKKAEVISGTIKKGDAA